MNLSVKIDATPFVRVCSELSRLSGETYEHVVVRQVGALLNNCIEHTRAAKRDVILKRVDRANYIKFADGHIISLWKKADGAVMFLDGSTAIKKKSEMTWHDMTHRRWSDVRWARFQALADEAEHLKHDPVRALASRGLAKHSWIQIAEDLGIEVKAPAYAKNAVPTSGLEYKNGVAQRFLSASAVFIQIRNDNPILVNKLGGAGILAEAMAAREAAFIHDVGHDVFSDIAQRAKRYPGIFVNVDP